MNKKMNEQTKKEERTKIRKKKGNMIDDTKKHYEKRWKEREIAYPCEYAIRIFKGSYPRLNLDKTSFKNKKILDMACGNGRNTVLLNECGFEIYGVEITEEIVNAAMSKLLREKNVVADIRVGRNDSIPFEDDFFDYLLSWNACYYVGELRNFSRHVIEYARVLKSGGYLILSIPKKTCFIYKNSEIAEPGYRIIKNDPFNIRNGAVIKLFENEEEIIKDFSICFKNFVFASIHDDCFGYNYHWHVVVCQKK